MLNNRQSGRRRGRGGQRSQGSGRSADNGNRIDNRARGNAPQLLEKYKTLARDAQMQGDRVMTEYYLQFADHYFRVVAENRARFEENRRQREDWNEDGEDGEFDERVPVEAGDGDDDDQDRGEERQRPQREFRDRGERTERGERSDSDRYDRDARRNNRAPREGGYRDRDRDNGYRNDRGERDGNRARNFQDAQEESSTIDVNVLPPAFGSDGPISPILDLDPPGEPAPAVADMPEQAPRRRGRPRRAEASDVAEA